MRWCMGPCLMWLLSSACSGGDATATDASLDARARGSAEMRPDADVSPPDAQRGEMGSPVPDVGAPTTDADAATHADVGPSPASDAGAPSCGCEGLPDSWRCLRAINHCATTVWLEAQGNETPAGALDGRTELAPGGCHAFAVETLEAGRLWGDTGCTDSGCETAPGVTPVTLAELTLGDLDFYDLSLVDGYNLPMSLAPVEGTFERAGGGAFDCGAPTCVSDLNTSCPEELAHRADDGRTVACLSGCTALGTDELCCRGVHATPDTCPASDYSRLFKAACPDAYSYAYDDAASTYTCRGGAHYDIVFCP